MEDTTETKDLKALIKEENPFYKRGDKIKIIDDNGIKKVVIRNIYSRRLEDLTFNDLKMMGYDNPNNFVKEWIKKNGSFDINKVVWVIVYINQKVKKQDEI